MIVVGVLVLALPALALITIGLAWLSFGAKR